MCVPKLAAGASCAAKNQCSSGVCPDPGTFAAAVNYVVGSAPWSVAVADLNADGMPDLVTTNWVDENVSVLVNQGNGTFAAAVSYAVNDAPLSMPFSVAVADLNADGMPDLAVAAVKVRVLLNQGDGTFAASASYAAGGDPQSIAAVDLNGDGTPDLVTANHLSNSVSVLLNQGNGTFGAAVDYGGGLYPVSVVAADLNGDGMPDLAVASWGQGGNNVVVRTNHGDGTFAAAVGYATGDKPWSVAAADLNGDGMSDLAVANGGGTVSVLLNHGDGTFVAAVSVAAGDEPRSVAAADLSGDGIPDLAVGSADSSKYWGAGHVNVLLNQGNGTFAPAVDNAAGSGHPSVAAGDLNGDGLPDLVVANRSSNDVSVLLNASNRCAAPTCADQVKNGDESDVDCGGSCPKCSPGQNCGSAEDCTSGNCSGGTCKAPSCSDGIQNQGESDFDCGGPCSGCGPGEVCFSGGDCASGLCAGSWGNCKFWCTAGWCTPSCASGEAACGGQCCAPERCASVDPFAHCCGPDQTACFAACCSAGEVCYLVASGVCCPMNGGPGCGGTCRAVGWRCEDNVCYKNG